MFEEEIQWEKNASEYAGKGRRYMALTLVLSIALPLILGIEDPTLIAIVSSVWFICAVALFLITFLTQTFG